ncbi:flavodoxin family protein [Provencibacterium massiliense]|uniref:flavodoxin family protein n=1 Tax=Provencibacterium massiliense TaxID=1841868 RepID=UPI0009A8612E|nr:flavodoxin family protein [Provencibacterium massiliense]
MAKRMLALLGSPRRSGMVSRMLDVAVQRAEKAGWEVVRFDLYELALLPCTGCMACRGGACCPLPDRLPPLRRELLRCDLCVLAAPVYFANVPGPVKTMFDRLAGSVMEDTSTFPRPLLKKEQRYLLLTACTTPSPFSWLCGQSRGALRAMKEFFSTAGMRKLGSVVFAGSRGKSALPDGVRRKILARMDRLLGGVRQGG